MNNSDIQLYTIVNNQLHEITVISVNKADWSAIVSCKYTKPFYGWDGMDEVYNWKAGGIVSLSDIYFFDPETLNLRITPIEETRRLSLGDPFIVHVNRVPQQANV